MTQNNDKVTGKKLLKEFLEEKDEKTSGRVVKYSSLFKLFSNEEGRIVEMMKWAYERGRHKR